MRRFLLYVHTGRRSALEAMATVIAEMERRGVRAVVVDDQADEIRGAVGTVDAEGEQLVPDGLAELVDSDRIDVDDVLSVADRVELGIVLGGDGTILRALEVVRDAQIPLHGVNLGHVGFLAESEVADLSDTVSRLLDGDYSIEERSTLEVAIFDARQKQIAAHWALNEASLEKADRQKMVNVVLEIDGRPVSSFGCDGVLLSSSTGSTAYAFSAGGPVVWPEVDAFLVVPLAAHALFARPLVLGRSSRAAVEVVEDNSTAAVLTLDGRRTIEITPGMRVETGLAVSSVRLARLAPAPFADRLVEKFRLPVVGWRGRDSQGR